MIESNKGGGEFESTIAEPKKASITNDLTFKIELEITEDTFAYVFFPQPSVSLMEACAPALEAIYSAFEQGRSPLVIIRDYERVMDEYEANMRNRDYAPNRYFRIKKEMLKNLFDKIAMSARVLKMDLSECTWDEFKENLTDDNIVNFEGLTLFCLALLRFTSPAQKKGVLAEWAHWGGIMEAIDSLKKRLRDSASQVKKAMDT